MNEKEIIKLLDLLIKRIEDFKLFSIQGIFFKEFKPNEKDRTEVNIFFEKVNSVILFGTNNDLFEKYNENGWYSLTEKGKELKKSNLGYVKFSNKLKPKKYDLYKIIPIILTVVFGSLNVYQNYDYRELKKKYDSLNTEYDSLKLKLNYLNNKIIEYKVKPLSDTLKSKKELN